MAHHNTARGAEHAAMQRLLRNPPFDQRIVTLPGIAGVRNLKRGKLVAKPEFGTTTGATWTLHFLYNPSTITLSHTVAMNALAPGEEPQNDVTDYQGDTQSSLSWSLLFDRTYETWDRSYRDKPAGQYGVYVDVRALYGILNMVPQNKTQSIDLITAPMQAMPVQVYFGGKGSLSYFGRIQSATVDYTHWTTKMIPNRCVVGLNMSIWPKHITASGGYAGSGNTRTRGGAAPRRKRRTVPGGVLRAGELAT